MMRSTLLFFCFIFLHAFMTAQTLHDFTMTSIDGESVPLSTYKGKVVLIVNVASFCGYTYQYEGMEQLYQRYRDRGLVVLAFPANDYGAQEPGTDEEIKTFCSENYSVSFPVFSKITVKGSDKHALFAWLTSGGGEPSRAGEIGWNFEKFLVDPQGHLVTRFGTKTEPLSDDVTSAIERLLRAPSQE
jgi:glutathione peroxidase